MYGLKRKQKHIRIIQNSILVIITSQVTVNIEKKIQLISSYIYTASRLRGAALTILSTLPIIIIKKK